MVVSFKVASVSLNCNDRSYLVVSHDGVINGKLVFIHSFLQINLRY